MTTAAHIGGGLGLKRAGPPWIGACPCCGYRAGFSVKDGEGGALLLACAVGGCSFDDMRGALAKRGPMPGLAPCQVHDGSVDALAPRDEALSRAKSTVSCGGNHSARFQ